MMGFNSAEADILLHSFACFIKKFGVKQNIICMIIKEYESIWITNYFKYQLILDCIFCITFWHQVNVCEVRKMVDKHSGSNIPCHYWVTFVSQDKAMLWDQRLIDDDGFTTFFRVFNCILPGNIPEFLTPRMKVGFSTGKTWKVGGCTLKRFLRTSPYLDRILSSEKLSLPSILLIVARFFL